MSSEIPKQFLPLQGEPMLVHSLRAVESCSEIERVVVVVPRSRPPWVDSLLESHSVYAFTEGGSTRQGSLERAMLAVPVEADVVAVHDAARPLLRPSHLTALLRELTGTWQGVVPGIPLEDAIKSVAGDGSVNSNLDRAGVWRVQTPQVFQRTALQDALNRTVERGRVSPDCSEMLTDCGYRVRVVRGDPFNFKVTTEPDLALAELVLGSRADGSA
jgi:2-C-methyl-D-erythritol 4-phosphate cytidylyltransferase